jgi:hypothetical protein
MNHSCSVKAIRFYFIASVLVVAGFQLYALRDCTRSHPPRGIAAVSLDDFIAMFSIDAAVLACAVCGCFLLRAVSQSRLHPARAVGLYVLSVIACSLIAPLLMFASQAFCPDCFRGERQLGLFAAPIISALLALGLLVFFLVSLFFCRAHHVEPRV